jgi:hypothetical protein
MEWVVNDTPRPLYSGKETGTHCRGSRVGTTAVLDGYEKSHPPPGFDPRTICSWEESVKIVLVLKCDYKVKVKCLEVIYTLD